MTEAPGRSFTPQQIRDLLNRACDEIIDAAELPATGARDARNLLVNVVGCRLDDPAMELDEVAESCYSIDTGDGANGRRPLDVVLGWVTPELRG